MQRDQVIEQKDQMIEQKEQMLREMVRMLMQAGVSPENIAYKLSLSPEDLEKLI